MPSFLYSTKAAATTIHELPSSLDVRSILDVLHNETLLPQILWPSSVMSRRQHTLSGLEGVLTDNDLSVALLKLADGVTCVEKIGGFTMTVAYSILDSEACGEETGPSHCLQLREERSVRALRPIASFAKFKAESPAKTQNLLRFFQEYCDNAADAMAALESIGVGSKVGKYKAE
ncbi:hypothetical protein A9K55_002277 [Cordyceps militaris]|uniref:Uncharacterized protein n=1 Tax=Cordyceps militaris TaxID=73501 RepID=A0A2H4S703_CORMI|nr:hypothetical protein A9K55_002277 [Cordyceps militaris]